MLPIRISAINSENRWVKVDTDNAAETLTALIAQGMRIHSVENAGERKCNQCGNVYKTRKGVGGSTANDRDRELFPYNGRTGVMAENSHWFHGAFCSDDCYDAAYYEPPFG